MIFYRSYPYAPKATMISAFSNIFGFFAAIGAICLLTQIMNNPIMILPAILLGALAAFLLIFLGRKYTDKIAEPESEKNLKTKPRFAMLYCMNYPDEYDRMAEINPEFGRLYMKDEKGRIVKRKK